MNKSKFLKRSLAALLAILMVVAMVPMSALAADDDGTEGQDLNITVDTYRATRNSDGDYEVTVWDSNDVTIAWAPIPGTTLKLVTRGENPAELDLPYKLYLAKNADVTDDNVYTVTLREKVGDAEAVDHDLIITVESSIPENDATLSTVRVENTSGTYSCGYLTGADAVEAHAISGDISGNDIVITLPFGMKPGDVGLGADIGDSTEIFAPTSIRARSSYTYDSGSQTGKVTVTAKTGTQDFYNVSFVNEKVFDSFTVSKQIGETDLSVLDEVTVDTDLPVLNVKVAKGTTSWVPTYTTADGVKRIMGTISTWNIDGTKTPRLAFRAVNGDDPVGEAAHPYDAVDGDGGDYNRESMLKVIGSGHAHWAMNGSEGYTDLLVRTKANPSGAFVRVHVEAVSLYDDAIMTEIQVDDSESKWGLTADDTSVDIVVDKKHDFDKGNTGNNTTTICSINVTTDLPAKVSVPAQKDVTPSALDTRHNLSNINTKSGSFTLRVTAEDGRHYRDYTINLTASRVNTTELEKLELRDGDGNLITTAVPESKADKTVTLKVPYKYGFLDDAGSGETMICSALRNLKLYAYPSKGAAVKAGPGPLSITKEDGSVWYNNGHIGPVIENSITAIGDVWKPHFTSNIDMREAGTANPDGTHSDTSFSDFKDTLYLTVSNADGVDSIYQVKLEQGLPSEDAEIKNVTANRAFDNDYVYSVATTLNQDAAAYIGAADAKGNALPVTVENGALRIDVPYDWSNSDTLYLTEVETAGEIVYRIKRSGQWETQNPLSVGVYTLSGTEQNDQSIYYTGTDLSAYPYYTRGFTNLTTSVGNVKDENILYVVSEKDFFNPGAGQANNSIQWIKDHGTAYKVYIRRGAKDTGKVLNEISADDTNVKVDFNKTYDRVTVTVPGSYNWSDYRRDDSNDFTLKFDTSKGALVIDKGQANVNNEVATESIANGKKYDDDRNGTTDPALESDSQKKYNTQMNEHDQWVSDETTFFVLGGELYIYDELTGSQTRVTGEGDDFTNTNWGEIKSKQAEIDVYDAAQESLRTYRLELVVGAKSNQNQILSLKVGDTAATIEGTSITATLPEDSEHEQTLTIEVSPMATVMVNGAAYLSTLPIDLSSPATIVVTAEDGSEATYTLTVTFGGGTTPDPDKPSSKYTDLDKVTNDTMRDYVRRAIDMGLMTNTGREGIFDPMAIVSRKDFAVIIARADLMANNEDITNKDEADARLVELYGGEDAFDDISGCLDVQKAAIKYCAEKSYIAGDGKGGFNPNSSIERQAAAIVLAKWRGLTVDESNTGNVNNVADWDKVANWAKPYVNAVMTDGLMSGTGNNNFTPAGANGTVNREQTAVMLVRVFDKKYPAFE